MGQRYDEAVARALDMEPGELFQLVYPFYLGALRAIVRIARQQGLVDWTLDASGVNGREVVPNTAKFDRLLRSEQGP